MGLGNLLRDRCQPIEGIRSGQPSSAKTIGPTGSREFE